MIDINLYLFLNTSQNEFNIEEFFSKYRLNKIKETSNKNKIKENIISEHLFYKSLKHEGYNLKDMDIKTTKNGKPYFQNNNLKFNISHSNDLYGVCYSNFEVGIDIEKINNIRNAIANKIYDNEVNLKKISYDQIIKDFTIKESYIKYFGLTIFHNLKSINILDDKVVGNLGKLYYYNFKYKNYYITITSKEEFKLNIYNLDNKKLERLHI